ncbi:MAG: 1-acyl-sn-glycerol-3-phosphate acyltransferase [Bacteroidia bacterium]
MIKVLRYAWAVYFLICFILFFLIFYPAFVILLAKESRYPAAHKLRRIWGRIIMFISGLRPSTTYEEKLDPNKTYIFTPNHFSYLDILSANVQMPFYFNFMAKSELGKIPLFKVFFNTIDIPVERSTLSGARKALQGARERLAKGVSLLNFPEGGIGEIVPKMSRYKMGAFKLAIEQNVDIVPITIIDNWKRMPSGGLADGGSPGKMRMHVHRPIPTSNLKDGDEEMLANEVYRIIEEKFNQMNGL